MEESDFSFHRRRQWPPNCPYYKGLGFQLVPAIAIPDRDFDEIAIQRLDDGRLIVTCRSGLLHQLSLRVAATSRVQSTILLSLSFHISIFLLLFQRFGELFFTFSFFGWDFLGNWLRSLFLIYRRKEMRVGNGKAHGIKIMFWLNNLTIKMSQCVSFRVCWTVYKFQKCWSYFDAKMGWSAKMLKL